MATRDIHASPNRREPERRASNVWEFLEAVVQDVVPDRRRTLHLILLVSIPPVVVVGIPATLVFVVIPHPAAWWATASCCLGTGLVAWLRQRVLRHTTVTAAAPPEAGGQTAEDDTSG